MGYANARNTALQSFENSDWILFVDADERVPPTLAREIRSAVNNCDPNVNGFTIPRRNVICGRVFSGGGWWPDYQLRLMRPDRCRYGDAAVHEAATCDGTVLALNAPFIHLNYLNWREYFSKQLAYARLASASGPVRRRSLIGSPGRTFIRRFIHERGFLDGAHGFLAAFGLAIADGYNAWLRLRAH